MQLGMVGKERFMEVLGDYTILKNLEDTSFGKVYYAEHRFFKKSYVLKLLPKELCQDPQFIERFEKKIGLLAKLDHPSIVKIHNISCHEGQYFLVMDPIMDAENTPLTLEKYVREKSSLGEVETEVILRQVASALDYAHRASFGNEQLIHGNIKPSNIFVVKKDKSPIVYISDFGLYPIMGAEFFLSRSLQSISKSFSVDEGDRFIEHFAFLSPEQKRFSSIETVGSCSDIYAFGVLSYYLLMKKTPEGYFDLPLTKHPQLKKNWNLLVCRCLYNNPEKRPAELLSSIEELLLKDKNEEPYELSSWKDLEKKVEDAMQMSFEFSNVEKEIQQELLDTPTVAPQTTPPQAIEKTTSHCPKPIIQPQEIKRPEYEPDPGAIFQKELNISHYTPKEVEIKEVEPILTEMMIISGGTYYRGSDTGARDERPSHQIYVSDFAMDVHPVTNEQFVRFLQAMGGEKDHNNNDIIVIRDSRLNRKGGSWIIESGYSKHPVVGVTWYGATAYAKWVGKRLPTEAEWEIAASGGLEKPLYPTGKTIERTQSNFFSSDTTAVMSYPPNGYGFYDIAGNVYEWCSDWYAYNFYDSSVQEPNNPKGPPQGVYRVLRGGCWKSLQEDLRCSHRHRNNPGTVNGTYGFRCCADVS